MSKLLKTNILLSGDRPALISPSARPKRAPATAVTKSASVDPLLFHGAPASTPKGRECVLKVLEATRSVLISHGYAGLTLRLVAERANISHSNVQYYFPTKERLTEGLMLYISSGYGETVTKILDQAGDDPLEKFRRYVRYYIDENRTEAVTVIFFELRAISQRIDFILDTLEGMYAPYRSRLENLLAEINPALRPEVRALRAALIISLIDGLMIFLGGKNARHGDLADLGAEAEREILRLATAPA